MSSERFMAMAADESQKNLLTNEGGHFGAVIVKKDKVVGCGHNQVLLKHDPTCHAEIQAIRNACENLKTHDLSDCTIYTSCYPCPMCLSAIIWANIKIAYYGNTASDAANIGFRDDFIYNFIEDKCKDSTTLELKQLARSETIKAFELFQKKSDKTIY